MGLWSVGSWREGPVGWNITRWGPFTSLGFVGEAEYIFGGDFTRRANPSAGVRWHQTSISFLGLVCKWTRLSTYGRIFLWVFCSRSAKLTFWCRLAWLLAEWLSPGLRGPPSAGCPSLRDAGVSPPQSEARRLTTVSWLWDAGSCIGGKTGRNTSGQGPWPQKLKLGPPCAQDNLLSLWQQRNIDPLRNGFKRVRICVAMATCHWILFQSNWES